MPHFEIHKQLTDGELDTIQGPYFATICQSKEALFTSIRAETKHEAQKMIDALETPFETIDKTDE